MTKLILTPQGGPSSRPLWGTQEEERALRLARGLLYGFRDDRNPNFMFHVRDLDGHNGQTEISLDTFPSETFRDTLTFQNLAIRLLCALIRPQSFSTQNNGRPDFLAHHLLFDQSGMPSRHQILESRVLIEQEVKVLGREAELVLWAIKRMPGVPA